MTKIVRRCVRYFMYDMKMYNKFMLIYIIFTIFPFLIFSLIVIKIISAEIFELEINSAQTVIEQADTLLCSQLQSLIEETYTIYLDNDLYEYLSSEVSDNNQYQTYLLEAKLSTIVESGKATNASLYLTDRSRISRQHYRCQSIEAARNASWYEALISSGKNTLWHFTSAHGYYVSSIYSKYDYQELIGYIVITYSRDLILDILNDMCMTENSVAFITDENSEPVIFSGNSMSLEEIVELPVSSDSYFLIEKTVENKHISGMPKWTLAIAVPYGELTRITSKMMFMIIISILGCIALLCFVIARIIGNITRRIDKLNKNMQRPRKGDFTVNDIAPGRDEISELRRNFNFMLNTVENLLEEKAQADEHQKDLELNILQAQINPHFLYNTLDMINWVAISETPREIPVITSMLARFYKLSLNSGARIVRLADEIEHVRLYIGIQNKRYDSALTLLEQIPEECMDCASIKILLQPIVENAVLHGIFEKDIPVGKIEISARREESDTLAIEITDDGVGMDQRKVAQLHRHNFNAGSKSYGLSNIEERIKLCYGNAYGLEFKSEKGSYTSVTIRIRYLKYDPSLKMKTKLQEEV